MKAAISGRRGEEGRERLERAALHCFVKRGIDAATTKEIAKAARMAEGNLYRHYETKEDLAWALYERHLGRFTASLQEAAQVPGPARARLEGLLKRFRTLFEEEPDVYTYILLAQHPLLKRVPKGLKTPPDIVAEVLKDGQKRREIRAGDPFLMASLLVGMVIRVALLKLHGWLPQDLDALEREVAEACWRVVKR